MNYQITTYSTLDTALSQKLINEGMKTPTFNFYQSPLYFQLAQSTALFKPMMVVVMDENRDLMGSLLAVKIKESKGMKGSLSQRVVIYGGPVFYQEDNRNVIMELLLRELNHLVGKKAVFTQFRNFYECSTCENTFLKFQYTYRERSNLVIDCTNREKVWKRLSDNRKRQLKQMGIGDEGKRHKIKGKNGDPVTHHSSLVSVAEAHTIDEVRSLYDMLRELYRNKVRKPLPSYDFFRNFFEKIHGTEWGRIFVVKNNNDIIGGIFCPITPCKTIYELYIVGRDNEYRKHKIYPSVMATWAAIDYAIKNAIPQFDFMGVGIPDKEYGVRDFKLRFGGDIVNYGRYTRINNKVLYDIVEFGYNLFALVKKI